MNLHDIIHNCPIEGAELERISTLIQNDENLKSILRKHSKDIWNKLFDKYQANLEKSNYDKKQRIRSLQGFEKDLGTNNSIPEKKHLTIVSNLARDMKDKGRKGSFYRDFYIKTLLKHFCEDPNFSKFLLEFEFDNSQERYPTAEIVKAGIDHCIKYGFPKKTVHELYEYVHFERLVPEDEKTIFEKHSKDDVLLDVFEDFKSKIQSLEKSISTIKLEMQEIKRSPPNENIIKHVQIEHSPIPASKFTEIETKIDSLSREIESIKKSTVTSGEFKREISRLEENFNKKNTDTNEDIDDLRSKLTKEILRKNNDLQIEINEKYDNALSELNLRLVKAIEENKKGFLRINEDTKLLSKVGEKFQNILKEPIFVHAWINYLSDKYEINLSLEEAVIYHSIFKSCNYIAVDDFLIVKSWIETLGSEDDTRIDSASPLWVNTLDWYGLLAHLENSNENYKIGILTNFDTALTESYLLPTLDKWFISGKKEKQKLFLVHSSGKEKLTQPNIYSLVVKLPFGQARTESLAVDISSMDSFPLDKMMPKVKASTLLEWTQQVKDTSFRKAIVEIPKMKDGIHVPESCYLNFKRLYSNLSKFFSQKDSFKISIDSVVRPYLETTYGSERAQTILTFITQMAENE